MPIRSGPTPATAQLRSRSNGVNPRRSACADEVTMHAAAASFWPEALPAVAVASGSLLPMIGRSFASAPADASGRTP